MKILKSISAGSFTQNYLTKFVFVEGDNNDVESEPQTDYQRAREMFDVLSDAEQKRYQGDFKKMLESDEAFNESSKNDQYSLLAALEISKKGEGLEKVDFQMMIALLPEDEQAELKEKGFMKNIMKKDPEWKVEQFELLNTPSEEKCEKLFGMLTDEQINELDENDVVMLLRAKDSYRYMSSDIKEEVFERLLALTKEKRTPEKKTFSLSDKTKNAIAKVGGGLAILGVGLGGGMALEDNQDIIPEGLIPGGKNETQQGIVKPMEIPSGLNKGQIKKLIAENPDQETFIQKLADGFEKIVDRNLQAVGGEIYIVPNTDE